MGGSLNKNGSECVVVKVGVFLAIPEYAGYDVLFLSACVCVAIEHAAFLL